jgi:hypothetical protein
MRGGRYSGKPSPGKVAALTPCWTARPSGGSQSGLRDKVLPGSRLWATLLTLPQTGSTSAGPRALMGSIYLSDAGSGLQTAACGPNAGENRADGPRETAAADEQPRVGCVAVLKCSV